MNDAFGAFASLTGFNSNRRWKIHDKLRKATDEDAIYDPDMEIYRESAIKFMKDFDPDVVPKSAANFFGEGIGHEMSQPKNMIIAGMKDGRIDDDSLHQYIEYPMLLDDEFDEFFLRPHRLAPA